MESAIDRIWLKPGGWPVGGPDFGPDICAPNAGRSIRTLRDGFDLFAFISTGSDLGLTSSLNYFWREGSKDRCGIEPIVAAIQRLRSVLLVLASFVSGALLLKTTREQNLSVISVFVPVSAWSSRPFQRGCAPSSIFN
jgi:hypothetical protein